VIASTWLTEVVATAYDILNFIVAIIAVSSNDVSSSTHISKYFKGFVIANDKSSSLFSKKFLLHLLSNVSNVEKEEDSLYPIITIACNQVYNNGDDNIPNVASIARSRLAASQSCCLDRRDLLEYAASEMLVAVNNWDTIGFSQHQQSFFQQNYCLLRKVSKVFQRRVGVSVEA